MPSLRIATIVGTRPELIKLSRVIAELDRQTEHVLIHTGQNWAAELSDVFFRDLEIRPPDRFLEAAGETPAETIARVIERSDRALAEVEPDAVLLLGDTNSCLSALAAKRRRIPIFHMEAGNRCFDERVPEEINRRVVDHISDINLTYTEHARRYLLREGLEPDRVIKTGSPLREVLEHYRPGIEASGVLGRLGLESGRYFVVSAHREENVDAPARLRTLLSTLAALTVKGLPVVFSTHPRTRRRLEGLPDFDGSIPGVRFVDPLGLLDYVHLQQNARCVVSDSGSLTEESSILSFPAVMLRDVHERPEGMDVGAVVMAGLEPERVLRAVDLVLDHDERPRRSFRDVDDYAPSDVSRKVVRIITSYVDYVRERVWREPVGARPET